MKALQATLLRHPAPAAAWGAAKPRCPVRARHPRLHALRTRSQAEYKELLITLRALEDGELAAWAAANRDRLSLPFLGWLSDEELAGSADEPDEQQCLWELGSKLMALREGLSPVGNAVLQEELRTAALRCSSLKSGGVGITSAAGSVDTKQQQQQQQQDVQQPAAAGAQQAERQQEAPGGAALVTPAFGSAVQATAALGLSPEGLALFQQQAAALETVVGASRARSLTEVIGRAKVEGGQQVQGLADADAAVRILDVLLTMQDREERASMLPDAFTPLGNSAAVDDDAAYFSPDEDQLFTSPLRLLQAIDLYLSRLQRGGNGNGDGGGSARQGAPMLVGGSLGLSAAQLQGVLQDLRDDVEAYWISGEGGVC